MSAVTVVRDLDLVYVLYWRFYYLHNGRVISISIVESMFPSDVIPTWMCVESLSFLPVIAPCNSVFNHEVLQKTVLSKEYWRLKSRHAW